MAPRYTAGVELERSGTGGFSSMSLAAVIAVLVFLGSVAWLAYANPSEADNARSRGVSLGPANESEYDYDFPENYLLPEAATSTQDIGPMVMNEIFNSYAVLEQEGKYTSEAGNEIGQAIASSIQTTLSYKTYTTGDIRTHSDTFDDAAALYSEAVHRALSPLQTNTEPEFAILAKYVETKDVALLTKLRHVADLYAQAAEDASLIVVPSDVAIYHTRILNALQKFSAVLRAMANNAHDPIGSVALLSTYNETEYEVATALNALKYYYENK